MIAASPPPAPSLPLVALLDLLLATAAGRDYARTRGRRRSLLCFAGHPASRKVRVDVEFAVDPSSESEEELMSAQRVL